MNNSQLTPQTLAHELNSLLDGAMRWLSLADQTAAGLSDTVAAERDQIIERQTASRQALQKMAELIAQTQSSGPLNVDALRSSRTIDQELAHVLSLLTPECLQHNIELLHELDPRVAELQAGVFAPVMINGLRNAIESCSQSGLSTRRVSISITMKSPRSVQMLIEDTGTGLPSSLMIGSTTKGQGRGLGLSLCRSLVDQCGGVLELANVPYGGGAVLSVTLDPLHVSPVGADAA